MGMGVLCNWFIRLMPVMNQATHINPPDWPGGNSPPRTVPHRPSPRPPSDGSPLLPGIRILLGCPLKQRHCQWPVISDRGHRAGIAPGLPSAADHRAERCANRLCRPRASPRATGSRGGSCGWGQFRHTWKLTQRRISAMSLHTQCMTWEDFQTRCSPDPLAYQGLGLEFAGHLGRNFGLGYGSLQGRRTSDAVRRCKAHFGGN